MKMLIAFVGSVWEVSKSNKNYSGSTKKILQT